METTKKVKICKCNLCGTEWQPKVENPLECPGCKRRDWNVSKEELL